MESNLALTLERKKKAERRTEECIQDAKRSFIEEFKASPTFTEEMSRVVEVFKASEEYHDSHVAFSEKIFHKAHKEGLVDYRKLIEEEHLEFDLAFLDYEDEDGEEVHTTFKLSISEKENIAKPPSFSTIDIGPSKPLVDTTS